MENCRWVIDVSSYQNLSDDQWKSGIEHGMAGVIIKSSQNTGKDTMLERHVEKAEKYNVPYGFYHWADPIFPIGPQLAFFMELASKYNPKCLWADMEQYWRSWDEWRDNVVYHKGNYVSVISASNLYNFFFGFMQEWKKLMPGFKDGKTPYGVYSAPWFINGYCPSLAKIINENVPYYWNMSARNWQKGNTDGDNIMDWSELPAWIKSIQPVISDMPRGVRSYHLWQLAEVPLEGFPKIDFNLLSDQAWEVLFGGIMPPPPDDGTVEPKPTGVLQYKVTASPFLNSRTGPKVTSPDIGDIPNGTVLNVLSVGGNDCWIEYEPGKWACVQQKATTFMEKL